jgi:hypothetical protein
MNALTQLTAIINRWDAAIADIRARFEGLLQQAWTASEPLLAANPVDRAALDRAWGAIEHRLHAHTSELSDTWDDICDAMSDVEGIPEGTTLSEGKKRDLAGCELEIRYNQFYRTVMAHAAESMRREALAQDSSGLACTQCGAPLRGITPVSQALDIACGHCQAVNTVDPGPALRIFAAGGALALGEAAALPAWEAMKRAEIRIDQFRTKKDVPMDLLETYEASARSYFTTRLEVEAKYVPEERTYVAARIGRYMHDVERKLRQFWQWRERVRATAG